MYEIVKNVLNQGGYNLTEIIKKIDTLWMQGKLNDDEYAELTEKARSGAKTANSVDVLAKLEELDRRVKVLESGETATDNTEAAEFVTGKWYYKGDKCLFNDSVYTCIAPEGVVCVWSPDEYPSYWEKT